jgi:hypothetical protein
MRNRCVIVALALVGIASGCSGREPPLSNHHPGPPTEGEARDAYFNTPLVVDAAVRELRLGTTESQIVKEFEGEPAITYRRAGRKWVIYPIADTERWDRFGSPVASEWELCFAAGKLASKRRFH